MAELYHRSFRPFSQRGPNSSVLIKDDAGDVDILTVVWNALGKNPKTAAEAELAMIATSDEIIALATERPHCVAAEAMIARSAAAVAVAVKEKRLKCSAPEAQRRLRHKAFSKAAFAAPVVRGVLNDPEENPEHQRYIVESRAREAGLL